MYKGLCRENSQEFEVIAVGPEEPDFELPSNFRHIKTANIKNPQCNEIATRQSQGDMLLFFGDDQELWHGGINLLYQQREAACNKRGDNRVIILPRFGDHGNGHTLTYGKIKGAPFASLNAALFDRELLNLTNGFGYDRRFIGVYYDCDLAMRFNEVGVQIVRTEDTYCREFKHKDSGSRLHRICKKADHATLDSFWVRYPKENEIVPSDEAYCYGRRSLRDKILVKHRLLEFEGYDDNDILQHSQGPKEITGDNRYLVWD
jgi:hypothetical protein|tara:strand:- start:4068 stop:4850 length:783 start_codon:yes stop_codon:yes gene_type:complete